MNRYADLKKFQSKYYKIMIIAMRDIFASIAGQAEYPTCAYTGCVGTQNLQLRCGLQCEMQLRIVWMKKSCILEAHFR